MQNYGQSNTLLKFIFKKFTRFDIKNFVNLSKTEYPKDNPVTLKNYVEWKFSKSYNPVFIYSCKYKDHIVGRIVYPVNMLTLGSHKVKTINPVDFLVHRDHRNKPSIFMNLINGPKDFFLKNIIIHTSNNKSDPLYRLLKFDIKAILDAFFLPTSLLPFIPYKINQFLFFLNYPILILTRLSIYFFRIFFGYEIIRRFPNQEERDALYKSLKDKKEPFYERTDNFNNWRYSRYNSNSIQSFIIKKEGKVYANSVLLASHFSLFKVCFVMDSVVSSNINNLTKILHFLVLLEFSFIKKCNFIFFLINRKTITYKKLYSFLFLKIHKSLLPHETPIYIRNSGNYNFHNYHSLLADLDYF